MKLYQKPIKTGSGHVNGVEVFFLTNDKKKPKQRVAYLDLSGVRTGTCKCGGDIFELVEKPCNWRACVKCSCDHSEERVYKKRRHK